MPCRYGKCAITGALCLGLCFAPFPYRQVKPESCSLRQSVFSERDDHTPENGPPSPPSFLLSATMASTTTTTPPPAPNLGFRLG